MINNFPVPLVRKPPPKRINWSYDAYFQEQMAKIRALNNSKEGYLTKRTSEVSKSHFTWTQKLEPA
jgi:hypothetical protein